MTDLEEVKLQLLSGPITFALADKARWWIVELENEVARLRAARNIDAERLIGIIRDAYGGSFAEIAEDVAAYLKATS